MADFKLRSDDDEEDNYEDDDYSDDQFETNNSPRQSFDLKSRKS